MPLRIESPISLLPVLGYLQQPISKLGNRGHLGIRFPVFRCSRHLYDEKTQSERSLDEIPIAASGKCSSYLSRTVKVKASSSYSLSLSFKTWSNRTLRSTGIEHNPIYLVNLVGGNPSTDLIHDGRMSITSNDARLNHTRNTSSTRSRVKRDQRIQLSFYSKK
jgi:hypothetical protein